jgi:hypothetical protein
MIMTDKNIRDFELLISTGVVPECARALKSMKRFSCDIQAFRKACIEAAAAAPDSHKIVAGHLIEFAESLGALDREISACEPGLKGISATLTATGKR